MWVHKYIYNTTDHTERKRYCHVNKHLENGSLWKSFVFVLALSSKTSLKIVFTYSCHISCFNDFFSSRHNSWSDVILRSSFNWFVRLFQNKSSDLMLIYYADTFSSLFSLFMRYCLKNEQECFIRFKNSARNCEFFERL